MKLNKKFRHISLHFISTILCASMFHSCAYETYPISTRSATSYGQQQASIISNPARPLILGNTRARTSTYYSNQKPGYHRSHRTHYQPVKQKPVKYTPTKPRYAKPQTHQTIARTSSNTNNKSRTQPQPKPKPKPQAQRTQNTNTNTTRTTQTRTPARTTETRTPRETSTQNTNTSRTTSREQVINSTREQLRQKRDK